MATKQNKDEAKLQKVNLKDGYKMVTPEGNTIIEVHYCNLNDKN